MRTINKIACIACAAIGLAACSEDANQWPVDESYSHLFRTTNLSLVETEPTSVVLSFNGVTSATQSSGLRLSRPTP